MNAQPIDRLEELLAEYATQGLTPGDLAELEGLQARHPEWIDLSFEEAAAAIQLAFLGPLEEMPSEVRSSIRAGVESSLGSRAPRRASRVTPRSPVWLGWAAAAAAVIVALVAWPRADVINPVDMRANLLAEANDAITLPWTATEDPAARRAEGDVIWSNTQQTGFMRFRGLEANDPSVMQYQLWVFDQDRDDRYPVDGGVFDVPVGTNEIVVPINAKIAVGKPVLFAVTVEKPGGVVVSSRERIVVVAQPSAEG